MKKLYLIFMFVLLFMLNSCSNNDENCIACSEPSETEIISEKIAAAIDEYHPEIARVFIYNEQNNDWVFVAGCNGYKLEPPFIQVCGEYYHIKNLTIYSMEGGLNLYFNY